MDEFMGWPSDGPTLLADITADNRLERWDERHEQVVRAPTIALAAALQEEFGPVRVFKPRLNRRFRPSVPPLRDDTGAVAMSAGGCTLAVVLTATVLRVSAGHWRFDGGQAKRYRVAVAGKAAPPGEAPSSAVPDVDGAPYGEPPTVSLSKPARLAVADDPGAELAAVLEDLAAVELVADPVGLLRGTPRGWPSDHPRISLLGRRGLQVGRAWEVGPWLATPEPLQRVQAVWRAAAPLVTWLDTHVGPSDPVPPRPRREGNA